MTPFQQFTWSFLCDTLVRHQVWAKGFCGAGKRWYWGCKRQDFRRFQIPDFQALWLRAWDPALSDAVWTSVSLKGWAVESPRIWEFLSLGFESQNGPVTIFCRRRLYNTKRRDWNSRSQNTLDRNTLLRGFRGTVLWTSVEDSFGRNSWVIYKYKAIPLSEILLMTASSISPIKLPNSGRLKERHINHWAELIPTKRQRMIWRTFACKLE